LSEGFLQKILFHDELPDLGVELLELRVAVAGRFGDAASKRYGHVLDGQALPLADQVRMHPVLLGQLGQSQLATDRIQRDLGLELRGIPRPL
jgi:hypothetical protein